MRLCRHPPRLITCGAARALITRGAARALTYHALLAAPHEAVNALTLRASWGRRHPYSPQGRKASASNVSVSVGTAHSPVLSALNESMKERERECNTQVVNNQLLLHNPSRKAKSVNF
jgi:hypothetical protein